MARAEVARAKAGPTVRMTTYRTQSGGLMWIARATVGGRSYSAEATSLLGAERALRERIQQRRRP